METPDLFLISHPNKWPLQFLEEGYGERGAELSLQCQQWGLPPPSHLKGLGPSPSTNTDERSCLGSGGRATVLFWQMQWQTDGYNQGTTSCGSAPGLSLQLILPAWCVPSKVMVGAWARRPFTRGLLTGDKCSRAENLPPHSTVNPPLSTLVQQNTGTLNSYSELWFQGLL